MTLKCNNIRTPLLVWINLVAEAIIIFCISRLCSCTKFLQISFSLPHNPSINLKIFSHLISNLPYIRTCMRGMYQITYMPSSVPFVWFYLRCTVCTSRKIFVIYRYQYIRLTILSSHIHFLWKNHLRRHRPIWLMLYRTAHLLIPFLLLSDISENS